MIVARDTKLSIFLPFRAVGASPVEIRNWSSPIRPPSIPVRCLSYMSPSSVPMARLWRRLNGRLSFAHSEKAERQERAEIACAMQVEPLRSVLSSRVESSSHDRLQLAGRIVVVVVVVAVRRSLGGSASDPAASVARRRRRTTQQVSDKICTQTQNWPAFASARRLCSRAASSVPTPEMDDLAASGGGCFARQLLGADLGRQQFVCLCVRSVCLVSRSNDAAAAAHDDDDDDDE